MKIVLFCQSLLSDWNHGNVHFLRGVMTELLARGHEVSIYEPRDNWSFSNLVAEGHTGSLEAFARAYPGLQCVPYELDKLDAEEAIGDASAVLIHEWNTPALLEKLGAARQRLLLRGGELAPKLLFHDTHHRAVTAPEEIAAFPLHLCDGVLAFGESLRGVYLERGWAKRVWTWHEAADTRVFFPREPAPDSEPGDLVWIGNWGDAERTEELHEFLIGPVRELKLRATVYGVRYPPEALQLLADAGIHYGGHLPNPRVPEVFASYRVTIHIPRRPYTQFLPGIPTIRPFEALACGIPLISALWEDRERLFRPGADHLLARDGREMKKHLSNVLGNPGFAARLRRNGRDTILSGHTCAHRADQFLSILRELGVRNPHSAAPVLGKAV